MGIRISSKSIKGIRSIWVEDMSATVNGKDKLESFRVTSKPAFEVKAEAGPDL